MDVSSPKLIHKVYLSIGKVFRQIETGVRNLTEHLVSGNDLLCLQARIKLALVFVLVVSYLTGMIPTRFHLHLDVGSRGLCLKVGWLKDLVLMLSHSYN